MQDASLFLQEIDDPNSKNGSYIVKEGSFVTVIQFPQSFGQLTQKTSTLRN